MPPICIPTFLPFLYHHALAEVWNRVWGRELLETSSPLTCAIVSDVARMRLGCGSDAARMWFGCGSDVVRMWFRMWIGSDMARTLLGHGSDMAWTWLGCVFGSGADSLHKLRESGLGKGMRRSRNQ